MATWNGNVVSYGSGGHWYVQIEVWDNGPTTAATTGLHIRSRIIFENTISDSSNQISGSDPAGAWTANNFSFSGAGTYLISQRDFECSIGYGGSTAHIEFSATGMGSGGTGPSSVSIDYPMPARQYSPPSAPPIGVDTITANSARIVVFPATDGGGAGISNYEAYVMTNNAWPDSGGNVVASAAGGSFYARGLARVKTYYFTARTLSTANMWSNWAPMQVFTTLPEVPGKMSLGSVSNIGAVTTTIDWNDGDNGGSAITSRGYQCSSDPTFAGVGVANLEASGVIARTDLAPGKTYYWRARAGNVSGPGPWSDVVTTKTLAGVRINVDGAWKLAVPYVNVAGVWKLAIPYVNVNGIWKNAG